MPSKKDRKPFDVSRIDKSELSAYIIGLLQRDIRDRDASGWEQRQVYSIKAYNGDRKPTAVPWKNACNVSVGLTYTLVNTAHANSMDGIWGDGKSVVKVEGVGPEDKRLARYVDKIHNWQILNDIEDAYSTLSSVVHSAFQVGNSFIKVIQREKINWCKVNAENLFFPVDAKGLQPGQTDHVLELIPLTEIDIEMRKGMKDLQTGKPAYEGLDEIEVGREVGLSNSEAIRDAKDRGLGVSLGSRFSADMAYILECYVTYPHREKKDDKKTPAEIVELVVSITPKGGKVLRVKENEEFDGELGTILRPYSYSWNPYSTGESIIAPSIPWIVRPEQEELDYCHNQNINAGELALKPPKFYDPNGGFDPETVEATPNGWYPVPDPTHNVFIPTINVNPIFERQTEKYWEMAQRKTGLTELFQGRQQDVSRTLGEAQLRTVKTEIRFKAPYTRLEQGFRELMYLTYYYNRKFMSKDTVQKILGAQEYKSYEQVFPKGIGGKFNFSFFSAPITERMKTADARIQFYDRAMLNPINLSDEGNQYRLLEFLSETEDIGTDIDTIITKPDKANIVSPQEAIMRIKSGEYDYMPHPEINAALYIFELGRYMRSESFQISDRKEQTAIQRLLTIAEKIREKQVQAMMDAQILKQALGTPGGMGMGLEPGMEMGQEEPEPPVPAIEQPLEAGGIPGA